MKQFKAGHGLTLAVMALALGGMIYLDWTITKAPVAKTGVATEAITAEEGEATSVYDPLTSDAQDMAAMQAGPEKNYGEAQLVSVNKDSGLEFFESARLARSKSRDEALDTIKTTLKNVSLEKQDKEQLTKDLQAQVNNITAESGLETMIKAKGFADCVVALDGNKANVTVMTMNDALTAAEVTKIRDILLTKCNGMKAENITVVEVK